MNYWKSTLTGFGMSFIATALCGSKVEDGARNRYKSGVKIDCFNRLLSLETLSINNETLNSLYDYGVIYNKVDKVLQWKNFQFDAYYKNNDFDYLNNHYWCRCDGWSVAKSLPVNNLWTIPTALLGALFHDKVGRDLTPEINEYFASDISSYLVTGGLFGVIGTGVMGDIVMNSIDNTMIDKFGLTQPWIYCVSIIQGFLIGTTAMAGAYFGDEKIEEIASPELNFQEEQIG